MFSVKIQIVTKDKKYILITKEFETSRLAKKIIELSEKDIKKGYKKLATTAGTNYGMCVFHASDNIDNFHEKVVGYRVFKNPTNKKLNELSDFAKEKWTSGKKPSLLLEFYSKE